MKEKLVIWIDSERLAFIRNMAKTNNSSMSSVTCGLIEKALQSPAETVSNAELYKSLMKIESLLDKVTVPFRSAPDRNDTGASPGRSISTKPTISVGSHPKVQALMAKAKEELIPLDEVESLLPRL